MATKKEEPDNEEIKPKSKKNKIIIISILSLLSLILIGGATLFYIKKQQQTDTEDVSEPVEKKKEKIASFYIPLDKFVVNIPAVNSAGEKLDRFIQIQFTFEIPDDNQKSNKESVIKSYMPVIKHKTIMILTSYEDTKLLTLEGKNALTEEIKQELNKTLTPFTELSKGKNKQIIDNILITDFIIQ